MNFSKPILRVSLAAALCAAACSSNPSPSSVESRKTGSALTPGKPTKTVAYPDGTEITAELALTPVEQATGMMYREHLPEDEGLLFIFPDMALRSFWMYQCTIALDMIWLDDNRRIVEISPFTPPCPSMDARQCPNFGGSVQSLYVLEVPAGQAAKHALKVGDELRF